MMRLRGREGERGPGLVDWAGEVEVSAAEVSRCRDRQRRAVGDGEAEALHRRPREAAERWKRRAVV